jgi:hypothetical protein
MSIQRGFAALVLSGVLAGCGLSSSDVSPKLEQAVRAVRQMTAGRQLPRSAFSAAYDHGTPSEYVSFLFSTLGVAEWPVAMDEAEAEAMRSAFITPLPDRVLTAAVRPSGPWPQLVIRGDDTRGLLIALGYEAPGQPAVLTEEWPLPQVSPAVGVREMFEDQVSQGAHY